MLLKVNEKFQVSYAVFEQPMFIAFTQLTSKISYNHVTFINLACETELEILDIHNEPILKDKFMYF